MLNDPSPVTQAISEEIRIATQHLVGKEINCHTAHEVTEIGNQILDSHSLGYEAYIDEEELKYGDLIISYRKIKDTPTSVKFTLEEVEQILKKHVAAQDSRYTPTSVFFQSKGRGIDEGYSVSERFEIAEVFLKQDNR